MCVSTEDVTIDCACNIYRPAYTLGDRVKYKGDGEEGKYMIEDVMNGSGLGNTPVVKGYSAWPRAS